MLTLAACLLSAKEARAADTERSSGWQTATTITMAAGVGTSLLMPRVFYSDPETTVGWKARWHVSVFAPVLANVSLTMANEFALKDQLKSFRPGCDNTNQGSGRCRDYGSLSSFAFLSLSTFGQTGVTFVVDTIKWSGGRVNVGSLLGNIALPLVLSGLTVGGRAAGNWETGQQVVLSSLAGFGTGVITGLVYSVLQRPECGYTGAMICW
ncbi:MAG: hypothetical protein FWD73_09955 [Polyangiaceae bacterium]|nr:hypothetical protein [Polyangiaceae bacterium]